MELTNIQELTLFNSDKPTSESKLMLLSYTMEALVVSGHLQDAKKADNNCSWPLMRMLFKSTLDNTVALTVL